MIEFLKQDHTIEEYIKYVNDILPIGTEKLWGYISSTDFFVAPASTQYHGAHKHGLVKHSLAVWHALDNVTANLLPGTFGLTQDVTNEGSEYQRDALVAALFHDAVKCDLYKKVQKWRKDKFGKWEGYDGYEVDTGVIQIDHGAESLRRIEKYYKFTHEGWAMAVAYHMGTPDDYIAKKQYYQAVEKYPEVFALHTADVYSTFILGY